MTNFLFSLLNMEKVKLGQKTQKYIKQKKTVIYEFSWLPSMFSGSGILGCKGEVGFLLVPILLVATVDTAW